ncbi:MAG: hypothetical protein AUK63_3 [bacterium P3]|nr:MAG: hypothetical protein AUK63_3 [bacterium P3]KWW42532.1 MAG: hypothetical protein F083_436 [bacterium F083]
MEIHKDIQYNQGIGKYKVLSSNAGVGSIVTTKAGFFIMPKSVSFWGFVRDLNKQIENYRDSNNNKDPDPEYLSRFAGVDIINDPRFVDFLKDNQGIPQLKYLIDVPHLSLSNWNYPKEKDHPLYLRCKENTGHELKPDHFYIPAIHFPRWFYSRKEKYFKPLEEWESLWKQKTGDTKLQYFAPPRDPYTNTNRSFKDNNQLIDIYDTLVQIPILLICKNGHISDIPWYELFCAGIDHKMEDMKKPAGFELFDYPCQDCEKGGRHELQWIENRNNSESWGTLKCKKCGKTHGLEGIMNIHPYCKGDTPWNGYGTKSDEPCKDVNGAKSVMQMALVTSNSVYYADSFNSLYIPPKYMPDEILGPLLQKVLDLLNTRWYPKALERKPNLTKETYMEQMDIVEKAYDSEIDITQEQAEIIKNHFLAVKEVSKDTHEQYRFEEYRVFTSHSESLPQTPNLEFKDIDLPTDLKPYFKKIQQVDTLAMTLTQLGFSRVSMPVPMRIGGTVVRNEGQRIFNEPVGKVYSLPANQSMGEGLFFEFNKDAVDRWMAEYNELFKTRYNQPEGEIGKALKAEIDQYGAPKFYLLHTFSHIIMKELEFSCGYPTASLQERLYYSDRMCGVLIYTVDGTEGSMGGLVWQGQPRLIEKIIKRAINNAKECSSDPLCWENEDQLNLAACFSCCLVSETSCEKRDLGLDRRALVDENFGYFKEML